MIQWHPVFDTMNKWGKEKKPFLFVFDFLLQKPIIVPLEDAYKQNIFYYLNKKANYPRQIFPEKELKLDSQPIDFEQYKKGYDSVHKNLQKGNSYLTNFTCATPIETNYSLEEIFYRAKARYKIFFKNQFIVFSPEIFVQIIDGKIYSFPMKGTIDAKEKNAAEKLLNNPKEKCEHATIVDLIRNDLSLVSENVKVEKYRYLEELKTSNKTLLQASSKIVGELPKNYLENLGTIFHQLLPAGSISGAPKKKTVEIIQEAEIFERNYYTGVFGIFDGKQLDSGVMIRFIEKTKEGLIYKSGGGITHQSDPKEEYQEMKHKIYVPVY